MASLIQAQHLHRYYSDTHAVNDISIELQQGEILGLLGPNGAGKSSCLQMLCGTLAPSAGQITINGHDLIDQPAQAKQHIGYLPDRPPLYPELSVDEYLDYSAGLRKINRKDTQKLRELAKQRCGLEQHGQRLLANLSKGYQQRVGIAQAIIHQPDVIVLDEPTVGLDPNQMREIRELIIELGQDHGVILSTHILPEVQAVCNRVQIIHQGRSVFNEPMTTLNQRMQYQTVVSQFKLPPNLAELQQLTGVEKAEALGDNRFRIHFKGRVDIAETLIEASLAQRWGLQELTPERQTLESIFTELTSGELVTTKPSHKEDTKENQKQNMEAEIAQ